MKDQAPQVDSSAIETNDSENAPSSTTSKRFCLRIAKHLYRLRRERARVFGADADLFGEPAWDILLKLYIASGQGKLLIRTEASMVGLIPQTTGLRILAALKERGLVRSERGSTDKRVWLESLTERGVTLMEACLPKMVEPRRRYGHERP